MLPLLLLLACASSSPTPAPSEPAGETPAASSEKPAGAPDPAAATTPQQSDADAPWPVMNVVRPAPDGATTATVTDVRTAGHKGYTRVVMDVSGPVGAKAKWATEPPKACGSGRPVDVEGDAVVILRLGPATAHDEAGQVTVPATELRPGGRIPHMVQICDHEDDVSWAIGLTEKGGMRLLMLEDPHRVVLDFQD